MGYSVAAGIEAGAAADAAAFGTVGRPSRGLGPAGFA